MGDTGDHIFGVDGIGIKRAYNLIREYETVHDLAASLPVPGKQLFIQNLNKSGDLIIQNLDLVDLPSYYYEAILHASKANQADYISELETVVEEIVNDKYNMFK